MHHAVYVRYVARELHIGVWQLFNVAYAFSYKTFGDTHMDVARFSQTGEVPEYVQDFIYSIIPEVREETGAKTEEQKAHKAP
jgi:hypothetical protein